MTDMVCFACMQKVECMSLYVMYVVYGIWSDGVEVLLWNFIAANMPDIDQWMDMVWAMLSTLFI